MEVAINQVCLVEFVVRGKDMDLNLLTDYLREKHPIVDGLSLFRKSDDINADDLEIAFSRESSEEEQEAAKKTLSELNLKAPLPGFSSEYREAEYQQISQGDMNDAVRKGVQAIVNDLIAAKILSPATIELFTPSVEKREDTPGGYFARIDAIKEKYPKE